MSEKEQHRTNADVFIANEHVTKHTDVAVTFYDSWICVHVDGERWYPSDRVARVDT